MKFLLSALLFPALWALTVSFVGPDDETAIKATIAAETKAFFDRDYAAWASCWLQSANDSQSWNNRDGSISYSVGWDKVGPGTKGWIEANPKPQAPPAITRDNWNFNIIGDVALVGFDQHYNDGKEKGMSREYRTMVRKGGQWKISSVQAFWDYKNAKPANE